MAASATLRSASLLSPSPPPRLAARLLVFAIVALPLMLGSALAEEAKPRPAGRFLGTLAVTARPVEAIDANPLFIGKPYEALSARELGDIDIQAAGRVGTVADGVSALVLRVSVSGRGQLACALEGGAENGSCEALNLRPSPAVDGKTVVAALYRPPPEFGPGAGPTPPKYRDAVETRDIVLKLTYRVGDRPAQTAVKRIFLARPPLVLVHGTFDEPSLWTDSLGAAGETWTDRLVTAVTPSTGSKAGQSFKAAVEAAGFKPFLLDYAGDFMSEMNLNQGTFEENQQSVWAKPGGIREALNYYRRDLNLAATRVDVVGHSLGGLLPRIYASSNYESPEHPYERPDNFESGDINRLVTLCTPHYGSAISALLRTLHKASAERSGVIAAGVAKLALTLARWGAGVKTDSGAVADQVPGSPALKKIGATPIPAFAVGCIASDADADDTVADPGGTYRTRVDLLGTLFYKAPELLQNYLAENGMKKESLEVPRLLDAAYKHWLKQTSDLNVSWLMGAPPALGVPDSPQKVAGLQAAFRAFVFLYDENDYTVGLTSQHGGLGEQNRIDIRGILHGLAPHYWTVQKRVIDVLKDQSAGGLGFAPEGFEPAGVDPVPAPPTKALIAELARLANTDPPPGDPRDQAVRLVDLIQSDAYVWGEDAIRWSGMVYAHAAKFMRVAEETETVFMFRPVNPDSTALIANNASTKPMAIKPKSSDWGPHRGLLPVDQAFSKKAEAQAGTIAKFDCDAYDNLADKPGGGADGTKDVQGVPFYQEIGGRRYEAVRTSVSSGPLESYLCEYSAEKKKYVPKADFAARLSERLNIGSKPPILLKATDEAGTVTYYTPGDPPTPVDTPPEETLPFLVLADKNGKYMTADYDTLAIASRDKTCANPPFHPTYGGACGWQIELIEKLNAAASTGECEYEGGNLVHHGPETNYTGSEYIDYPITAFIPGIDGEPSRVVAIRQGPAGYRDMHIKRLFFMLQQQGWRIDPNPKAVGWRWGDPDPFTGYELSDQTTFPPDVPQEIVPPKEMLMVCVPSQDPIRDSPQ